jgi:membrane protein implicated in regulation of membrane protease activity
MDVSNATMWWVLAGVLVAIELVTGTFYLLMLATGAVAAAIASHLGVPLAAQLSAAAVVGGGATVGWHLRRARSPSSQPAERNRDVNLDIGEQISVQGWATDGTTTVRHRGANWQARLTPGAAAQPGLHKVVAVEGNHLVLGPMEPASR